MDSEIFARIREYLADQLEVEPEKITPDSDIVNDFGADSLDVIDMITTLSDEFGVEIPDEDYVLTDALTPRQFSELVDMV